ncbi:MAG: hypothetical protein ACSLFL_00105 [Alphaproteobacteria bacterium]
MQAPETAAQWTKHWLYDWGGSNVDLFLAIQRTLPDGWIWLPEVLTALGSYWGAPAVVVLLLVWRRVKVAEAVSLAVPLYQFVLGLALAIATAALAKSLLALPRPFVVLGDSVYRATSGPDSRCHFLKATAPVRGRGRPVCSRLLNGQRQQPYARNAASGRNCSGVLCTMRPC